jgi:hypothetical protein
MLVAAMVEAWRLGWPVRVRCLLIGPKLKTMNRMTVWYDTSKDFDMKTLVWTWGD